MMAVIVVLACVGVVACMAVAVIRYSDGDTGLAVFWGCLAILNFVSIVLMLSTGNESEEPQNCDYKTITTELEHMEGTITIRYCDPLPKGLAK